MTAGVGYHQYHPPHPALSGDIGIHAGDVAPEKKLERDAVDEVAVTQFHSHESFDSKRLCAFHGLFIAGRA